MRNRHDPHPAGAPRLAAAAAWLLSAGLLGPALAQELPEGMLAGPWILEPYVEFTYESDDNIFRRNELIGLVQADRIATVWAGATATLPVRNSLFSLSADLSRFHYAKTPFDEDFSGDFEGRFEFNFGSGDAVATRARYLSGFSQIQQTVGGEGGEDTFEGLPFDLNEFELELSRAVPGRMGYALKVKYSDLDWDRSRRLAAPFDYSGWEGSAEIRRPLAGRRWLLFQLDRRRFDHFDPAREPRVGAPFRKELADSILFGIRGFQSEGSPFFARLGWGRFEYEVVESEDFAGIVGSARWRVQLGGSSILDLGVQRRPLPSNFDTYYINNDLRVHVYREWLQFSAVGLDARLSRNQYGDVLSIDGVPVQTCGPTVREDDRFLAEAYIRWAPFVRTEFRIAATFDDRNSNCAVFEYESTQIGAGVKYGWN